MPKTELCKLYIDGKWVESSNRKTFSTINPSTEQIICKVSEGTIEDARSAIDSAEDAYQKWSDVPAPKRGEILLKVSQLLRAEKEMLAKLVATEMGKVLSESRGDIQ